MIILASGHLPVCYTLLFCLLLGCVYTEDIIATVGTDVTLPCNYDAQYYGRLSACWGRGAIPNRGCADEVLKSDGTSVVGRLSERYQLLGRLNQGDMSLTIRHVEESDSGMYGCRVEIPGWFNDHKQQLTLRVVAGHPNSLKVETGEVKERALTVRWAPVFDGGSPITSYRIELKNKGASWDTAVTTEVTHALTQVTLVDLHPAKNYNLRMFAINSVGTSEASNVLIVTTKEAAPEGPPLDMHLEAVTSHSIKVTWKPPKADLRNGVVQSYSISYREYDRAGRQYKKWQQQSVTATREQESVILNNLKPSTQYEVLIQAKTNAGIGPATTAALCSTLDEVQSTSTAPAIQSTSLPATVWMQHTTNFTSAPAIQSTSLPAIVQDTTSFTSVHSTSPVETVAAATAWGRSTSITSVPPDPPVVEIKEVIDNTISLVWTPGFDGDSPITGYYLEYKAVNTSWDYTKTVVDFSPNQTEATIIEINPSTYNIRMFAKNSLGTSKASNVLTITTGEAGHQRDKLTTTTPTNNHVTVSVEDRHSGHLAAIVVPVVLVVLMAAIAATWHLRRMKRKHGSLSMWGANGGIRYRVSESLQEL